MHGLYLLANVIVRAKRVSNIHAVSGCKVSVHQIVSSEVLHSFGYLKAHVQHSFLCFTNLHVCGCQEDSRSSWSYDNL